MDWFARRFSFISDEPLRAHLAEAFYQARFVGRLQVALNLPGQFNNAFIRQQSILYASIYEALIDHYLERNRDDPEARKMFQVLEFREHGGFLGKDARMAIVVDGIEARVIPCRQETRARKLVEIRFDERLATAVRIGLVQQSDHDFILSLYKSATIFTY